MPPSYHGRFIWYELMTDDVPAAERFYGAVIGWDARAAGVGDGDYRLFAVAGTEVAGLMALPEEAAAAGARPGWTGYVAVDDLDATVQQLRRAGGAVHREPEEIPGVGRFAIVADPHGAVFALFRGMEGDEPAVAPMGTPGHAAWRELYAGELDPAFDFYAGLFGWTRAEAMDMGPMGIYQLFAVGDETLGGMMTRPEGVPVSWAYYFACDGIDAALDRVKENGGTLLMGPQEVPGGVWIIQCLDPQGAPFAMVGPRAG